MDALYQNQQIRALEAAAIDSGIEAYTLMQRAGEAAFQALRQRWPQARAIVVCCGKGNNGGDGWVVARLAAKAGLSVELYTLASVDKLTGAAKQAAQDCLAANVKISCFSSELSFKADVLVDGLLGSGLQGKVQAPYHDIIATINQSGLPVLALDVPSGLDVDSGKVQGCAVCADLTMTFIGLKRGLYSHQAVDYCGEIRLDRLGLSNNLIEKVPVTDYLLDDKTVRRWLPPVRARDSNKGCYGHVLVVGGDYGMAGAVRMAAESAARVGAGLVTVATRAAHVAVVSGARPELMCQAVDKARDLKPLLAKATVVVIGPGLGKSRWSRSLLSAALDNPLPKLVNADALNLLSEQPLQRHDWVLTPHPGEAGRLLNISCAEVQENRFQAVADLQQKYGGVAVLKGAGSLIQCADQAVALCAAGNPGMATGGMGDVLSGVIAGLLAQGLGLAQAAMCGVFIHATAADHAVAAAGERGLLASDLFPYLRALVNRNHDA